MLVAVDEYPSWIGEYVREVQVLERDSRGRPRRARAAVHVAQSPFGKNFDLEVEISTQVPRSVRISRVASADDDVDRLELLWHLQPGRTATVTLEFAAEISLLPTWLPVGGAGDAIAAAALEAATTALEESWGPARQRA
jgi:hypothetical protein